MSETRVVDGVLRFSRPDTRWLSTGWNGGLVSADAAYNVTVPEGFDRTDIEAYTRDRRRDAGFDDPGPTLLTGVDMAHACGARHDSVVCVATAGISNPAVLPMEPEGEAQTAGSHEATEVDEPHPGTVNLLLGTTHALDDGALATMLATAVEAKTATLLARTGFPGTTTDAVVVGCDPTGESTPFAGSSTAIGASARACVREAVSASLESRYETTDLPASVDDATYGVTTRQQATVFDP